MNRTLLIVLLLAVSTSVRAQTPSRTMTVTIDDLPFVAIGTGDYVTRARTATAKILNTLKKHKVPAVAFVNEGKLEVPGEREARIALLREWVKQDRKSTRLNSSHGYISYAGLRLDRKVQRLP